MLNSFVPVYTRVSLRSSRFCFGARYVHVCMQRFEVGEKGERDAVPALKGLWNIVKAVVVYEQHDKLVDLATGKMVLLCMSELDPKLPEYRNKRAVTCFIWIVDHLPIIWSTVSSHLGCAHVLEWIWLAVCLVGKWVRLRATWSCDGARPKASVYALWWGGVWLLKEDRLAVLPRAGRLEPGLCPPLKGSL